MRRILLSVFFIVSVFSAVSASAISEVQYVSEPDSLEYDVTVDLSQGTSSSEIVKISLEDGVLQLDYKGDEPINVRLVGSLEGTLAVKSDSSDILLALDGVEIRASSLPAMQLKSETNYTLYLVGGTSSYISDSPSNTKKGAVTSSGNVLIEGSAELELEVFKKHGFKTDGALVINSGNVVINGDELAEGNMISADTCFIMNGGSLTIDAKGSVYGSESKGIKVNGVEGKDFDCGFIEINGGTIDISSVGKAITAGWKAEEDGTTATTDDDPVPNVYVNGGVVNIVTTGIPREDTYTNGVCNDDGLSPEGIEAKNNLYFNGGDCSIITKDDCINAGNLIQINGGSLYLLASDNDAFDSNGTIEINGGTVFCCSSSMEQAFDCDNDSNFTFTGGVYVGLGNGNNIPRSSRTTAYSIAYGNAEYRANEHLAVLDQSGNALLCFKVPSSVARASSIVVGSALFEKDQTLVLARGSIESSSDKAILADAQFSSNETIASFDLTDYTVSEGYIGMNTGAGMGFGGMGGFGGNQAFGGNRDFNAPQNNAFASQMDKGRGQTAVASDMAFLQTSSAELPSKIEITGELTQEEAMQAINYLMQKYLATEAAPGFIPGSGAGTQFSEGMQDMRNQPERPW